MAIRNGRGHWSSSGWAFTLLALPGGAVGLVLMGVTGMLAMSILIGIVGALAVRPASAYHSCPQCPSICSGVEGARWHSDGGA